MTNSELLRDTIEKKGFKLSYIASLLEIVPLTLANKIDNVTEFKANEIYTISKLLDLSLKEREEIFFKEKED